MLIHIAVSKYYVGENWMRFKALMVQEPDWHRDWLVHGQIVQGPSWYRDPDGTGTGWYKELVGIETWLAKWTWMVQGPRRCRNLVGTRTWMMQGHRCCRDLGDVGTGWYRCLLTADNECW